jgi:hypothetical protein
MLAVAETYGLSGEEGPEHNPNFRIQILVSETIGLPRRYVRRGRKGGKSWP